MTLRRNIGGQTGRSQKTKYADIGDSYTNHTITTSDHCIVWNVSMLVEFQGAWTSRIQIVNEETHTYAQVRLLFIREWFRFDRRFLLLEFGHLQVACSQVGSLL